MGPILTDASQMPPRGFPDAPSEKCFVWVLVLGSLDLAGEAAPNFMPFQSALPKKPGNLMLGGAAPKFKIPGNIGGMSDNFKVPAWNSLETCSEQYSGKWTWLTLF